MPEWLMLVVAAVAGFLVSSVATTQGEKVVEVVVKEAEKGVSTMTTTLVPLYTAFVYILLAMAAAGVIAFVVWTFMQVFGEKKAGKEV